MTITTTTPPNLINGEQRTSPEFCLFTLNHVQMFRGVRPSVAGSIVTCVPHIDAHLPVSHPRSRIQNPCSLPLFWDPPFSVILKSLLWHCTGRAGEDGSCLRPRGHCDRPRVFLRQPQETNWCALLYAERESVWGSNILSSAFLELVASST
jgi:hypothetical protein